SFLYCYGPHPSLPSFPTRRSSDLAVGDAQRALEAREQLARGMELQQVVLGLALMADLVGHRARAPVLLVDDLPARGDHRAHVRQDRKSTRLNSSHVEISYAVFCLK